GAKLGVETSVAGGGVGFLAAHVTGEDAECVRRLRAAGAIVVGKANLSELALSSTTINPHFGTTPNPWRRDRVAGGSSGGSAAAVAARGGSLAPRTGTPRPIPPPAAPCGVRRPEPTPRPGGERGILPPARTSL